MGSSVQKVAYNPAGLQAKLVESAPAEFSSATVVAAPVAEPVVSAEGTVATFENSRGMHPVDADYKKKSLTYKLSGQRHLTCMYGRSAAQLTWDHTTPHMDS